MGWRCAVCETYNHLDLTAHCEVCGLDVAESKRLHAATHPPAALAARGKPDGEAMVLVFGILGLFLCAPLGIVAVVLGHNYHARCRAAGVAPEAMAQVGWIMGIISVVLLSFSVFVIFLNILAEAGR